MGVSPVSYQVLMYYGESRKQSGVAFHATGATENGDVLMAMILSASAY